MTKTTNVIKPVCPRCWQTLVPAAILVEGQRFSVYMCDCLPQPVDRADIKQARKIGQGLAYSIEVKHEQ